MANPDARHLHHRKDRKSKQEIVMETAAGLQEDHTGSMPTSIGRAAAAKPACSSSWPSTSLHAANEMGCQSEAEPHTQKLAQTNEDRRTVTTMK